MAIEASTIREQYRRRVEEIRADRGLSVDGKRRALAKVTASTQKSLAGLRTASRSAERSTVAEARARLFGAAANPAAAISRRDAATRAAAITTPRAALDALAKAETHGDSDMEKAIIERAVGQGWRGVLEVVRNVHPELSDDLAIVSAPGVDPSTRILGAAEFSVSIPSELRDMSPERIEALASEEEA